MAVGSGSLEKPMPAPLSACGDARSAMLKAKAEVSRRLAGETMPVFARNNCMRVICRCACFFDVLAPPSNIRRVTALMDKSEVFF